ncbi:MAG TPA: transcriptional repressor LexA [Myxococcota bacterium]|nr:transcriptional repressor LexA [Myxococcota bacterium]HPC92714.1 transcriptional repressor LexA [Myxococcota bacterium]HQE73583.1 transcriptional repressor LexA [Myxococcota bacterium]HQI61561.1 transcriptional repressor LexA [Myxococcota bacterium]HRR73505.1 transcriptional repressor LexA [Myxococcota bacterium]
MTRSNKLTPRQTEVLRFITSFTNKNGVPPTVREIGYALKIKSTNAVAGHLAALEKAGFLVREPNKSRSIRVKGARGQIPVLGRIAAGSPVLAVENIEETISTDSMLESKSDFALRVQGDSMIGDGIMPGDMIFVQKTSVAERGQIVVALLEDEATVKRFVPTENGKKALLQPSNPAHKPIEVDLTDERFKILGVVKAVFRQI